MGFLDGMATMFGRAPRKPTEISEAAEILHGRKRRAHVTQLLEEARAHPPGSTWRNRRWAVLIGVNLLFTLSFWLDIQIVEGSQTASRFVGFHLADVYSSLLVTLAERHVAVNLVIGSVPVSLLWGLYAGRAYCSWVCPYHLLAGWTEALHQKLAQRGIVRDHPLHRGVRSLLWIAFAGLALLTGQTLFLTLNPIGILSRAVIYGPSLALGWVGLLLLFALNRAGFDLFRANAIKIVIATALAIVTVPVFIFEQQVAWLPAVFVSIGFTLGATAGARFAVIGGESAIRRALAVAVLLLAGHLLGLY